MMNRTWRYLALLGVAAALFAGAAIAAPAVGWSAADTETRLAQAGPDSHGMGGGMGPGRMGGFGGE